MGGGVGQQGHGVPMRLAMVLHSPYGDDDLGDLQREDHKQSHSNENQEEGQLQATPTVTLTITGSAVGEQQVRIGDVGRDREQPICHTAALLKVRALRVRMHTINMYIQVQASCDESIRFADRE